MVPLKRGLFITFEGTEGAGKSTLIRAVAKQLKRAGKPSMITREPGGSRVAESIRELILKFPMNPLAELFLYEAARAEHLDKTILPALKARKVVLCDRFTDSSLAYQGYARGLPWKEVKRLNAIATRKLTPDLTVFLDISPAKGLRRARVKTRFEKEGVAFQKRVRRGFLKARAENPTRWLVVSADSGTPDELAEIVAAKIFKKLGQGR